MLKSVAVKEAEILKDGSQVAQIVQEDPNGGFEYIDDLVRGSKDTLSTLPTEVVTMH